MLQEARLAGANNVCASGTGAGTTTVYTVAANKTLYITDALVGVIKKTSGSGVSCAYLTITDASDVLVAYLAVTASVISDTGSGTSRDDGNVSCVANFTKPVRIPTGYKVKLVASTSAVSEAYATINGIVE
jgi:hypothetical protein